MITRPICEARVARNQQHERSLNVVRGRKNLQQEPSESPQKSNPGKTFRHHFDCTLKSVSIAKDKASVGLSIPRSELSVDQAVEVFCGAQLSVMLEADPNAAKKEPDG